MHRNSCCNQSYGIESSLLEQCYDFVGHMAKPKKKDIVVIYKNINEISGCIAK